MKSRKLLKVFLASVLCITLSLSSVVANASPSQQSVTNTKEYIVKEDAYVRNGGNENNNYDFQPVDAELGYPGSGINVLNVKSNSIISLLKFDLPSKEEVAKNEFNKYEFEFDIFKNPDYNSGDQVYYFNYTTDNSWKEKEVTWKNKPQEVQLGSPNVLAEFEVPQGFEYEHKEDTEKTIHLDITDGIKKLVEEGQEEVTIFVTAKNNINTSLMFHSRETNPERGKPAKIIASKMSFDTTELQELVDKCSSLNESDYTKESFTELKAKLDEAKKVLENDNRTEDELYNAYLALEQAINELVSVLDPDDPNNVAYGKPTRSNLNKNEVYKVNDGNINTSWSGKFYPSYVDIDLMDNYDIEEVLLNFPAGKITYYKLYGSNDGKNYDEIYQSRSDEKKTEEADVVSFDKARNYRIIRVYVEYTEGDAKSYLSEVKVYGTKQNTNTEELRKGSLEEITGIQAYDETVYAKTITEDETLENVYGIIDRTIGAEYRDWFTFEIAPNGNNDYDYFELSDQDGKIHIKGNEGLSLTTGLNYYYKNYVNVQISEQTMQVNMPESIVPIGSTVRKETPMKVRYAFNYCTLSYTFAFFGEEEWQKENDWLALNGVNVVLDLAGQEATWIKFLMNFGYSYDDAKDWLTGPGYYAWQFMGNMESFGGPVPDGYVIDRVDLARKTQRWKNSLGMQTVLQGYAGMVPTNFKDFYEGDIEIISQGGWNGFTRPDMIATDSKEYDEFADLFYAAQDFVYGNTTDYYAVDPFHEGGIRPAGLTDEQISKEVLQSMLKYDKDAVWTVQGWQTNPTNALLKGMGDNREDHVLVVDLIKYPLENNLNYKKTNYTNPPLEAPEFNGTSWVWGLLGNFGGNQTMNGQIQVMVDEIQKAKKESQHMVGLGIISEATNDNPLIYDLIFDLAWADESFNLDNWIDQYVQRRYGGTSANAEKAWDLIKDANYNEGIRLTNELFGVRTGGVPRKIGKKNIGYDTKNLENALRLLIEDFDKFKGSEGYRYDLTEIMRQVTSNYATLKYHEVIDARDSKDIEAFRKAKDEFLNAFDVLNEVEATQKEQLAGEWIGKAADRAEKYDDFSNSAFKMNAKSLITTWGSAGSSLIDYGFRTYEGMFLDLRKTNWTEYLDQVEANILNGTPITVPEYASGYVKKYWKWVIGDQDYTRDAKDSPEDLQNISQRVLEECVFTGELDPNIGDIALNRDVEAKGNNNTEKTSKVTDGKIDDSFVAKSYVEDQQTKNPEIIVDLLAEFDLTKINVVMDYSDNVYYNYEIYVSADKSNWTKVAEKVTTDVQTEKGDVFDGLSGTARYVKIVGTKDSNHIDDPENKEMAFKEVRVYGNQMLPNLEQLQRLVETAENMNIVANPDGKIEQFNRALKAAQDAVKEQAAPDIVNVVYWDLYSIMIQMDTSGTMNVALKKPVTAHNDPDGNSANMVDGNTSSYWNSGRLSVTGKPYEDLITPGWAIVDLKGLFEVSHIDILFNRTDLWHQYELYSSLDGKNWLKLGEKKTETTPNKEEDTYDLELMNARYIKIVTTNIQKEPGGKRNSYFVSELTVMGKPVTFDKEALEETIGLAEGIDTSIYTEASVEALQESITSAKEVLTTATAQQEIDAEVTKLQAAIDALEEKIIVNKEDLKAAIDAAKTKVQADYTSATWKEFSDALAAAEEIFAKTDATQENVDAAKEALEAAITGLVETETEVSASSIHALIERFEQEGAFGNAQTARALKTHMTAVTLYEKQEAGDKVIKHMKSFKVLLDYQKDSGLISEKAYNALMDGADALIKNWQ